MTSLHDKFGWRSSSFYDSSPLLQRLSFHSGWAACSVVVVTPGSGFCGLLNLVWRRNDGFRSCIFTRPVARIPRLYHLTSRWLPGPKACGFDSTYSYSAITFFSMSVCLPHCNLFFPRWHEHSMMVSQVLYPQHFCQMMRTPTMVVIVKRGG